MRLPHYLRTAVRLASSGIKNNLLTTFVSIGVVGLILLIFSVFVNLSLNIGGAIDSWKRNMGIVLYLHPGISPEDLQQIEQRIRDREEVGQIQFISAEEAWGSLSRRIGLGKDVFQTLGENPLPPVFEVKLKNPFHTLEDTRELAAFFARLPGVEEVDYGQEWVERASRFFALLESMLIGFCLVLGIASVFVIGNTIRLIILNRQEEIEILGLLGATPGFIAFPYLIEGFVMGFCGGVVAMALSFFFYRFGIVPMFQTFGFLGDLELTFLPANVYGLIIFSGGIIGFLGSGFSVKRYLPK